MPTALDQVFVEGARFIGVITPSGNTVVERVTQAIVSLFPGVTALFSRTPVHGDSDPFPQSYGMDGMLAAARLLAHAKPDVLVWNGSKGAKIGLAQDHELCAAVTAETGLRCSTSILAMDEVLRARGIKRVATVTPYDAKYQKGLTASLEAIGYEVVAERFAELKDNIAFASIAPAKIATMVREVAAERPEAVLALCTNFPAATVLPAIEAEAGIFMLDSTSIGVWKGLRMAGVETRPAAAWGRLFAE